MLQFSLPMGRWLGVPVRAHISLVLLLALAMGFSAVATGSLSRGLALWLALLAAVAVREIARAIAAAYVDLPVRALFLLPVGGVMALAPRPGAPAPSRTRAISLIGSAANLGTALLLLGFAYGVDPHVRLFAQPWISLGHILRSAVWLQVLVGLVNLLPSPATTSRPLLRSAAADRASRDGSEGATRPRPRAAFSLWTAAAAAMMLAGILAGLLWPVLLGLTVLLVTYTSRAASTGAAEGLAVSVQEVMLTELLPLNASSTLRDALRQTTHTVQDLFPVLRGEQLVGWISRAALAGRLRTEGDGFLQGAMVRTFPAVAPTERLGDALRRATTLGAGEFIPVVEDGAMVGLLTPASLERSVAQWRLTRVAPEPDAR